VGRRSHAEGPHRVATSCRGRKIARDYPDWQFFSSAGYSPPMWTRLIALTLITFLPAVENVEIRPRLVQGDKFRLDVTHIRRDSARPQLNVVGRYLVDVYVVSAASNGFVLDWVPGETTYDNPQILQDPMLAMVTQATKGLVYRIALSPDGGFSRVVNEGDI